MIISGIYQKQSNNKNVLVGSLYDLTKKYITKNKTYFEIDNLKIIAGETNNFKNQGQTLKTKHSFLIGKIFNKINYKKINQQELEKYSGYSFLSFTQNYWGNYLFIKQNPETKKVELLRDPVGQFPLFYMEYKNLIIFSSKISILYDLLEKKPNLNWAYFSSYLMNTFITSKFTAFERIYELPSGCELKLSKTDPKTSLVWDPLAYVNQKEKQADICNQIIDTTSHVLESWLEDSKSIFLDFSGGLDSTSLLFLSNQILKKNQRLFPVNWFNSKVRSSDERRHAEKISKSIKTKLIKLDTTDYLPLSSLNKSLGFRPNWPNSSLTHLTLEKKRKMIAEPYQNIIFMSGHGGDHIFLCPPPLESLSDFLIQQGIKGYFSKLKELAIYYRCSLFPLLKSTIKGLSLPLFLIPPKERNLNRKTPWFSEKLIHLEETLTPHPFFKKKHRILPGKYLQIKTIYKGLATLKQEIRRPMFYPLFSQPLLELALSIPTYETYSKGFDRYPFRKAISQHFKTNQVWRRDKGETSGVMQQGFQKNFDQVHKLCLEGKIAQQGLLDKTLFLKNLKYMAHGKPDFQWPLSNLICAELFFKYWKL